VDNQSDMSRGDTVSFSLHQTKKEHLFSQKTAKTSSSQFPTGLATLFLLPHLDNLSRGGEVVFYIKLFVFF